MYFYNPKERPSKKFAPGLRSRTFWGEKMLTALVDLEAETDLPSHSHPNEQISIILQGELEVTIAGETKTLSQGELFIVPPGVEHSVRTGSKQVQVMDVFSPVREEFKY
jgi:quercetin dioxygenase-like cupin family protein